MLVSRGTRSVPTSLLTLTTIPPFEPSGLPQFFHLILKVNLEPHTLHNGPIKDPAPPHLRDDALLLTPSLGTLYNHFSFCQGFLKFHNLRAEITQLPSDPKLLARTLVHPSLWWSEGWRRRDPGFWSGLI